MNTADKTIRLTTAQAIIRYLAAQYIDSEGKKTRVCGGGFGIFGHGYLRSGFVHVELIYD